MTSLLATEPAARRRDVRRDVVRGQWRIEHPRHSVRDVRAVTWGADACRVRSGSAPQV